MKICDHPQCVMPAKWKPKLVTRPPVHYEPLEPGEVHLGLCFCDIHKDEATVDALFSNDARIGLDRRFVHRDMPAPDWARCTIVLEPMDPRGAAVDVAKANGS